MRDLKLFSLNIEGHKHLHRLIPFLKRERADVICLQEVFEPDMRQIARALQMQGLFARMTFRLPAGTDKFLFQGVCLLTKLPYRKARRDYYYGHRLRTPTLNHARLPRSLNRLLLSAEFEKGGEKFRIGTTHFTWTPDGAASRHQQQDLKKFLKILAGFPEVAFCGDLNAPRGGKIFTEIARHYSDHIPKTYRTSINGELHYAGPLQLMVDGLFSTPGYTARNVKLVNAPSDHRGIRASLTTHS